MTDVNQPLFTGVGVALVTLFDGNEDLDVKATAELAARLVELGMRAVVVCGTTGEAMSLNPEERRELIATVRQVIPVDSGIPLIVGSGAPSPREAAQLTTAARDGGADAALVLSPPGSVDLGRYYRTVEIAAAGLPIFGYHFPAVSSPGIPVTELSNLPLNGLKDSSGDPQRLLETLDSWDGALYVGASSLLSFAGPLGCAGAILQLANAEPERCARAFAGDAAIQRELTKLHLAAKASFPHGIKRLTAERFGTSLVARLG